MVDFHFLRPWWLVLLPIGAILIWRLLRGRGDGGGWSAVVEPALRLHVLAAPRTLRESRWPLLVALAAWTLAVGALAGPAWERLPVPTFRSDEALVVVVDLSRSMDAADLAPSRLARAKLKLLALLERRAAGQTALVVFSTHAFTVTPLTTDTRTIASLASALDTGIMPSQGSSAAAGLIKAGELLSQAGASAGEVLLITDTEVARADLAAARGLRDAGHRVHVLAVGTEQGAPIAQAGGGFLTDANGQVVVPRLNAGDLQALAAAGGGRFARLAPDERDLDTLFAPATLASGGSLEQGDTQYDADVWRDQGFVLALLALPLIALGFRRGWVCVWALWFLLPVPHAAAFEWQDLWKRSDQRGYEAMLAEQPQHAAELFDDPQWRGAAQYRAAEFGASAATLEGIDSAQSHYNRGNALAKAGRLEPAIEAYERALELDPEHEDALYNRELLQDFLEQNPEQRQPPQDPSSDGENAERQNQDGEGESESGQGEQASGEGAQQDPDEQAQGQQARSDPSEEGQGSEDDAQNRDDTQGEDAEQQANESAQQDEAQMAAEESAPGPQDVEQWASEQAAEQWLRRIPQDPGGLLRRKFLYQYQRLGVDQDGRSVRPGEAQQPW